MIHVESGNTCFPAKSSSASLLAHWKSKQCMPSPLYLCTLFSHRTDTEYVIPINSIGGEENRVRLRDNHVTDKGLIGGISGIIHVLTKFNRYTYFHATINYMYL